MRLLLSLSSIALFITCYIFYDIYVATGSLMLSSLGLLIISWYEQKAIDTKTLGYIAGIWILGLLTLWFRNDIFIKAKPTLIFWGMSLALGIGQIVYQRSWSAPIFLSSWPHISPKLLQNIDTMAIIFYFLLGLANVFIALTCSTQIWILSKTLGSLLLHILFFASIFWYIHKNDTGNQA